MHKNLVQYFDVSQSWIWGHMNTWGNSKSQKNIKNVQTIWLKRFKAALQMNPLCYKHHVLMCRCVTVTVSPIQIIIIIINDWCKIKWMNLNICTEHWKFSPQGVSLTWERCLKRRFLTLKRCLMSHEILLFEHWKGASRNVFEHWKGASRDGFF